MGWQEGQGLGKSNQGRTEIITVCNRVVLYLKRDFILNLFAYSQADRRSAQAGLGMKTYAVVTDDYRQVFMIVIK